jgi:Protein of unknown function (DUF2568)
VLSKKSTAHNEETAMVTGLVWVNAALAFLLELAALGLLGWGGWLLGGSGVLRVVLAVGLPAAAAVAWGLFAAPQAGFPSTGGRLAVQLLVFGGAAVVLALAASPRWGTAFAVVVAANLLVAALAPQVGAPAA